MSCGGTQQNLSGPLKLDQILKLAFFLVRDQYRVIGVCRLTINGKRCRIPGGVNYVVSGTAEMVKHVFEYANHFAQNSGGSGKITQYLHAER